MKKKGYVYKMVVFIDNLTRLRNLVEFWMTSVIPSHSQRVDCYFRQKNVYIPLSNNQYKMSIFGRSVEYIKDVSENILYSHICEIDKSVLILFFFARSTVLSQERGKYISDPEKHDPTFTSASLIQGSHCNTCGHVMHADCWQG